MFTQWLYFMVVVVGVGAYGAFPWHSIGDSFTDYAHQDHTTLIQAERRRVVSRHQKHVRDVQLP